MAGRNASIEQINSIRTELGLNQPLYQQYLVFLKQSITWDWGESWNTRQKITTLWADGIGPSLCLTLPAFLISFLISLLIALYTTKEKDTWKDHLLTNSCLALMSVSFLVYIIVLQYGLAFHLNLFPVNGWDSSWIGRWQYLLLPWIISICVSLGPNILIYRSALLEEAQRDYVKTAQAKGLSEKVLFLKHILKNALIPISTIVLSQIPLLLTGSLLLEAFFGIPGLGGQLIEAIQSADFPLIKAFTVAGSMAYIFFNFITDLVYISLDPRVRLK